MKTVKDIIDATGVTKEGVYYHCKSLAIKKQGRDYVLTDKQYGQILKLIGVRPRPKRKEKAA